MRVLISPHTGAQGGLATSFHVAGSQNDAWRVDRRDNVYYRRSALPSSEGA